MNFLKLEDKVFLFFKRTKIMEFKKQEEENYVLSQNK